MLINQIHMHPFCIFSFCFCLLQFHHRVQKLQLWQVTLYPKLVCKSSIYSILASHKTSTSLIYCSKSPNKQTRNICHQCTSWNIQLCWRKDVHVRNSRYDGKGITNSTNTTNLHENSAFVFLSLLSFTTQTVLTF